MVNVSVYNDVVEVEVTDFVTIQDVIESVKEYAADMQDWPSCRLLLIDATKCRTNIRLKDLNKLDEVNKLLSEKFELLKVAIILDDPIYTAICMVYQKVLKSDRYFIKVFSTKGASYRWLRP